MTALFRLDLHASVVTLCAVWLISGRHMSGQWLMLAAQALWFGHALRRREVWLAVQSLALAAITVRALVVWGAA